MKAILLLLFPVLLFSQSQEIERTITPQISFSTVDSVAHDSAGTELVTPTEWVGVDSGQVIFGPLIPEGTYVTAVNATGDTVTISQATLDVATEATLNFGLYSATAYGSGDWLGLPFLIWNNTSGGTVTLESILIADSSDVLGNTDLALFSSYSSSNGLDNAAANILETDYKNIITYVALTTAVDLGNIRILAANNQGISIPRGGKLYGRLVAKSTPTFTSTSALYVRLRFR